jgi:hypothetical protein
MSFSRIHHPLNYSFVVNNQIINKNNLNSSSTTLPSSVSDSIHLQAPVRFGNKLSLNHSIVYPLEVKLDFEQSGQAQRASLLKSIEMMAKQDKSHLVFSVDMLSDPLWPHH